MNMTREGYEIMEMSITSEALLEIVERHFDRIRPAQRLKISNGLWDMKFKTDLLEMFIQLVQTLSTDVLKRVYLKKFADSENHHQAIKAVLEESIADIFSKALNIEAQPLDLDHHAHNLTEMLESEVSQKVNSVLLLASDESQQTVNIDSNLSTVEAGFHMVDEAKHCLKACLASSESLNTIQEAKQVESNACGDSETAVKKSHCKCCFLNFAKMLFNELTSSVLYLGNSETGPAPHIDFNNLQEDVEELFEEMDFMYRPDSNQRFQDFLMKEEIDWFYRQVTDRLNDHLQMTGSYLKPTSPLMKKLSDSVLTVKPGSVQSLSPQLLYFMVEDEVAKIIQKLLYFLQNPPEDNHPRYDIFEMPMRQPNSPVSTKPLSTKPLPTEPDQFNCERFARAHWVIRALLITIYNKRPTRNKEFTAIVKRLTQKIWDKIDVPETCIPTQNLCKIIKAVMKDLLKEFGTSANLLASAQDPTNTHFDAAVLKYLKRHLDIMKKSSVDRFFSHIYEMPMRQPNSPISTKPLPTEPDRFNCERFARAHWVIRALLITIYNKRPTRNEEFTAIVKRVTQKIWDKIDVPETCIPTQNLCKIIKPAMKDLLKEFGTSASLLASAQDPTNTHFDAAVLKYLKRHLDLVEKSSVDRFFSHIWKIISSPVRTFSI